MQIRHAIKYACRRCHIKRKEKHNPCETRETARSWQRKKNEIEETGGGWRRRRHEQENDLINFIVCCLHECHHREGGEQK